MPELKSATVLSSESLGSFHMVVAEAATGALPGQWGAFWTDIPNPAKPGEVLKRAWSFAEIGPTWFRLFVACVGPGTEWLATRRPGDTLRYTGPWGSRFLLDDGDAPVAFFAAGSGISPIGTMVDASVARGRPARVLWETPTPAMPERLDRWRAAGVRVEVGPRLQPTGPGPWWFAGDGARLDEVVGDTPAERVERFYTPRPTVAA